MAQQLINLDALRAESRKVLFLGHEFEIGYIPSGLAIPLIENHNKDIQEQKESDSKEKIMSDEIRAVSLFCSFYDSAFTEDFLRKHASKAQIDSMYTMLIFAIYENFVKKVPDEKTGADESTEKKTTGVYSLIKR
ncbi:hypothetical protein [Treponema sp.]|uniref:hypothetical protein n=1 Tax=Treponema sp. TaxID=166 RepID=UPI003FA1C80F